MVARVRRAWVSFRFASPVLAGLTLVACSGAPIPAGDSAPHAVSPVEPAKDPCLAEPGKPPPEALARTYEGVLAKARCRAEVDVIMAGVSRALGVKCNYCHLEPDFTADTQQKRIANFMARELVPRLRAKDGRTVTCESCHMQAGRGVAKILGSPRSESRALEWMTAELVETFESQAHTPLRCSSCHGANWGSPAFQRHVLLSDALSQLPREKPAP